jgi:glycosyltransferase involved in cell wall biosynthesis
MDKSMKTNWHICVLIPAHNEEELLPSCLNSILAARNELPSFCTVDIVLAVNGSSDQTLELGKTIIGQQGAVLNLARSNVGLARKIAAKVALKRYKGPLEHCWLANTDADCKVPENWLSHQLKKATSGLQGVAGIVKVDSFSEHGKRVQSEFLANYLINADGTHPHVHGANIGFRADAYRRVGGWNELTTAEDHDIWNRMTTLNIPKISDAQLFVYTSGRKKGRAPHGFAAKLASFNKNLK